MNTRSTDKFLIVQLEDTPFNPELNARLLAALDCELAHVARRTPRPPMTEYKLGLMLELRSERARVNRRKKSKLLRAGRLGIRIKDLVVPRGSSPS